MSDHKSMRSIDLAPFLVRIALAVVFIYHGYGKVFAGGHEGIANMMEAQGMPYPQVLGWLAALTEFGGGILLIIGFLSRVWALGLAVVMGMAIYSVHGQHGFDLRGETGTGYEYCFALGMMALAIVCGGPGAISLDRSLFGCRRCKVKTESSSKPND